MAANGFSVSMIDLKGRIISLDTPVLLKPHAIFRVTTLI
jgi:hypothetical protein